MPDYILSKKVLEDLSSIWDYTFNVWSETQADKYYKELIASCISLSKNKLVGSAYFEIYPELLGLKVNRYIVFYIRNSSKEILIVRILHQRMDLKSRIEE